MYTAWAMFIVTLSLASANDAQSSIVSMALGHLDYDGATEVTICVSRSHKSAQSWGLFAHTDYH